MRATGIGAYALIPKHWNLNGAAFAAPFVARMARSYSAI